MFVWGFFFPKVVDYSCLFTDVLFLLISKFLLAVGFFCLFFLVFFVCVYCLFCDSLLKTCATQNAAGPCLTIEHDHLKKKKNLFVRGCFYFCLSFPHCNYLICLLTLIASWCITAMPNLCVHHCHAKSVCPGNSPNLSFFLNYKY